MGLLTTLLKNLPDPETLVKMGYLGADQVGNPTQVKRALTTYTKAISGSPAAQRKAAAFGDSEVATTLGQKSLMTPEEVVKNEYVLVPTGGDGSATATTVSKLAGLGLDNPVDVWGGGRFGERFPGLSYASMSGRAQDKQDQFTDASKATGGRTPLGVHVLMGEDSYNFMTPTTELMVAGAKAAGVPKKIWKQIDKEIASIQGKNGPAFPHFVGFSNNMDDAMSQLLGINGFSKEQSGPLRKAFLPIAKKAAYRDEGLPNLSNIIDAIAEPELRKAPTGTSGFSIFEGVPGADLVPHDVNLSYDSGIRGTNKGGMDTQGVNVPSTEMFFDPYAEVSSRVNKNNEPFSDQQRRDTLWMDPKLYQVADQRWLDHVQGYIEKQKRLAALGLIGATGIAGAEESQPDLADPEAAVFEGDQGAGVSPTQFLKGAADTSAGLLRGATTEALGVPNALVGLGGGLYNMATGSGGLLERFGQGAESAQSAVKGIPILGQSASDFDGILPRLTSMSGMTEDEMKKLQQLGSFFSPF